MIISPQSYHFFPAILSNFSPHYMLKNVLTQNIYLPEVYIISYKEYDKPLLCKKESSARQTIVKDIREVLIVGLIYILITNVISAQETKVRIVCCIKFSSYLVCWHFAFASLLCPKFYQQNRRIPSCSYSYSATFHNCIVSCASFIALHLHALSLACMSVSLLWAG